MNPPPSITESKRFNALPDEIILHIMKIGNFYSLRTTNKYMNSVYNRFEEDIVVWVLQSLLGLVDPLESIHSVLI